MLKKLLELFNLMKKREKFFTLLMFALNLVGSLAGLAGIAMILPFINVLSDPSSAFEHTKIAFVYDFLQYQDQKTFIIHLGIAILLFFIASNLIMAFVAWYNIRYSEFVSSYLTNKLITKYLFKKYEFFLARNPSELLKNLFTEIANAVGAIIRPFADLVANIFLTFTILAFIFVINPVSTIVIITVLGCVYSLIFYTIRKRLAYASKLRVALNRERYKLGSEAFGGIKDLKLVNKEHLIIKQFMGTERKLRKSTIEVNALSQLPKFFLEAIAFGGILLIAIILFVSSESFTQIIPLLAMYAFAGYRLMPAMQVLYKAVTTMKANAASLDLVLAEMQNVEFDSNKNLMVQKSLPVSFQDSLVLKDIVFRYDNNPRNIVDGVSLSIKKNSTVAFIGTTGCGKTTLVDIILGLLEIDKGSISVDGINIHEENLASWQEKIGYVPQQIYLIDNTVTKNIAFASADKDIDFERVKQVAKIANIHDTIENSLPAGYDTVVGDRGVRLSGGQRQRVGIARALYKNPDVLVFDEATSALDNATEEAVMEAIGNLMGNKTIIIIAHRMSTLKSCDLIYKLDNGKVVATGKYEDFIEPVEKVDKE